MADTRRVVVHNIVLKKVPQLRDDNCDGCFYKNLTCAETKTRNLLTGGQLACSVGSYIWEVQDADVDEGKLLEEAPGCGGSQGQPDCAIPGVCRR